VARQSHLAGSCPGISPSYLGCCVWSPIRFSQSFPVSTFTQHGSRCCCP
jgi:hypothetical protein